MSSPCRLFRTHAATAALLVLLSSGLALADDPPPPEPPPAALTRNPKLTRFVRAEAPASLAERGTVDVQLVIDIDEAGKVVKVEVAQPTDPEYDAAAVAAARQFEFEPGYAGDKPVPVRITYRYRFKMQPAAPPPPPPAPVPGADGARPPVPTTEFAGTVLKRGDRTAIAGATVSVDAGEGAEPLLAQCDPDGKFAFAAVPLGERVVKVFGSGITPSETKESFSAGKRLVATYYVTEKERYASTVRGRRLVKEVVEQTLDVEEIKRIPGTQGDTLKAVQNLPGVARAPFGSGQLIVWGSRPGDTRVYVDDVSIPTLYHFFGIRSVLPTESVQSLTFSPGGYGADHGWALGGLVQVDTARPKTNGYHGFVQLDLFDGSFRVEGPITKTLDFALSARRSWIDVFLPLFTPNTFQLSPKYYDYQAKLHWKASSRDDVDVLFFGSDDLVTVVTKGPNPASTGGFDSHIYFNRLLARWLHRFDDGAQLNVTGSLGYDIPFQFGANFGNNSFSVDVRSCPYSLRATLRQPLASFLRLDAGVDFEGTRYGNSATSPLSGAPREDSAPAGGPPAGPVLSGKENAFVHQVAPWVSLNFSFFDRRLTLTPAARLAIIEDDGTYAFTVAGMPVPETILANASGSFRNVFVELEPRVAARYQIVPELAIKAAMGVYNQAPSAQTLFGPFGNPNARPEKATHYVLGFDVKPYQTLSISIEGFYKDLRGIIVGNQASGSPALVNEGIGRVYGGELLVRQELWKGFFAWISYTLSRSERKDHPNSPDWRVFQYDQTHILTVIASYDFGRGYDLGVRFRYVTGNPYTPVTGGYVNLNGGGYTAINGPLYSGRLAEFLQLDVRAAKKWTFKRVAFQVFLDIQNVTNNSSPEGYQYNFNFTKSAPVAGIPFFPDLGLRVEF